MDRRLLSSFLWLLIISLLVDLLYAGFDLNEMPEDDIDEMIVSMPRDALSNESITTTTEKPLRIVPPEFYQKVVKLFDVLRVCDTDHFDVNSIQLPSSFEKETKVMIALQQVAKDRIIKIADRPRLFRIMQNCFLLQQAVMENAERNANYHMPQQSMTNDAYQQPTLLQFI